MNTDDSTIQRIRKARHEISEANRHDPKTLVDYYLELQKKYKDKLQPAADIRPAP